jgi:hypothetical protein
MNTGKALIAGLAVTIGLLAASYGFEGIAQLAGPEEEEEVHSEETETHGEDEAEDIELGDEQDAEDEAAEGEG